jgi:hypothetical protein
MKSNGFEGFENLEEVVLMIEWMIGKKYLMKNSPGIVGKLRKLEISR